MLPVLKRKREAFQQRSWRKSSDVNSTGDARFQERGCDLKVTDLRVDKEALMLSGGKSQRGKDAHSLKREENEKRCVHCPCVY